MSIILFYVVVYTRIHSKNNFKDCGLILILFLFLRLWIKLTITVHRIFDLGVYETERMDDCLIQDNTLSLFKKRNAFGSHDKASLYMSH